MNTTTATQTPAQLVRPIYASSPAEGLNFMVNRDGQAVLSIGREFIVIAQDDDIDGTPLPVYGWGCGRALTDLMDGATYILTYAWQRGNDCSEMDVRLAIANWMNKH